MSNNKDNQNNLETGSILDIINEKATNLEHLAISKNNKDTLYENIKLNSKRERLLRESTVSIKHNEKYDHNAIIEVIEKRWIEPNKQVNGTYWQDKSSTSCQFVSQAAKNRFLDFVMTEPQMDIKDLIQKPNSEGQHYVRKPVRLEINNVRGNIKADKILKTLETELPTAGIISEFKEGKPNLTNKARSILFRVNAAAFRYIFESLSGAVPYVNLDTGTKIRLNVKINARPWQCRECFSIGQHQCQGKMCVQCGQKGHESKGCRTKTRYCNNCRRRGHRAKDSSCPTYLNATINELRKMDIPIEFYEEDEQRMILCKQIQLK